LSRAEQNIRQNAIASAMHDRSSDDLFHRHADWLRQLLGRRLRAQPADIDDLVQDTYLRAARQPEGRIVHPKAFLAQTALNLFRDGKRREAVRAEHRRAVGALPAIEAGLLAGLTEQEAAVLLEQIVADMPPLYRDVFALNRFRHMTNADIAQHLGVSVKTVEWRLGKALEYCAGRLRD
jgi:RNA polymerase sigma factor (sigma-70 family)